MRSQPSSTIPGVAQTFRFAIAVVLLAAPVLAHHTVAYIYDPAQNLTLTGVVNEVDWKQPHVVVRLDVKSADGAVVRWDVEAQAPPGLLRHGIQQDTFKPGSTISSTVCVARDGSHKGWARNFVIAGATFDNVRCEPPPQ